MRAGSNPRSAICHCTPDASASERSQRRRRVRLGQLLERAHPPARDAAPPRCRRRATTSKRITVLRRRLAARRSGARSPSRPEPAEVDQHLDALGRVQRDARARARRARAGRRRWRSAASAAVAEPQLVGARVGRVEEAQPVDPALDAHARRDRAVDQDRVAAEAEVDVLRVAERPVAVERVVGQHERHVVLALRAARAPPRARRRAGRWRRARSRASAPSGRARGRGTRGTPRPARSGTCSRSPARRDHVHRVAVVGRRHVAAVQVDVGVERQPVASGARSPRGPCARGSSARVDARRSRRSASRSRAGSRPGPRWMSTS